MESSLLTSLTEVETYHILRTPEEMKAWAPPEGMTTSEWAEKYRHLDAKFSSSPGPWRNEKTPYLVEIMDALNDVRVETLTFKKCARMGFSEAILNYLGYIMDQDPSPVLLVYPNEKMAKNQFRGRIKAMIKSSPVLDETKMQVRISDMQVEFPNMLLYLAGAESAAGLSMDTVRIVLFDETDKYPSFSGREADPLSLGKERTTTYWNRKHVHGSTPTISLGFIHGEYQRSDQRRYHVRCPHCGEYQILIFAQLKWPKEGSEEARARGAYYECRHCDGELVEKHRFDMNKAGVWVPEGHEIDSDRMVSPPIRASVHQGYHINCLYSPFLTFEQIVREWLDAQPAKDPTQGKLMHFINSKLGEIWEPKEKETYAAQVKSKSTHGMERMTVPSDALVLTAGVDVQKDWVYWTVRAWGYEGRSWMVACGVVEDLEYLVPILFDAGFKKPGDADLQCVRIAIDSGYRTDDVRDFCREHSDRAMMVKGNQRLRGGLAIRPVKVDVTPEGSRHPASLLLWHVNNEYMKDWIARGIHGADGDPGDWRTHQDPPDEYCRHIASEHKIFDRNKRTGAQVAVWALRPGGGANHFLDAEVYCRAAAEPIGAHCLRRPPKGDDDGSGAEGQPPPPSGHSRGHVGGGRSWRRKRRR